MDVSAWSQLLDDIREASLDGRSWHSAVRGVGLAFESAGIAFYGQSTDAASFTETAIIGIGERYVDSYKRHFSRFDNPWVPVAAFWKPGVIRTEQALQRITRDRNCLRRSGYYRDWIVPQGFRHSMSMVVDRDLEGSMKLTLYRGDDHRQFDDDEVTRFRHLGQQIRVLLDVAPRYRMARMLANLSLHALDQLDFGVVMLDAAARVLDMNRFARTLVGHDMGLHVEQGILRANHPDLDGRLRALLESDAGVRHRRTRTLDAGPPEVPAPLSLAHVALPSDATIDAGAGGQILLIVCPERARDERLLLLEERFSLTGVELELCRGLLQGFDLRQAGAHAGLTYETTRWYLKQLFNKTTTHRQADLVRVLLASKAELTLEPSL